MTNLPAQIPDNGTWNTQMSMQEGVPDKTLNISKVVYK
jgi:hypothetical protein